MRGSKAERRAPRGGRFGKAVAAVLLVAAVTAAGTACTPGVPDDASSTRETTRDLLGQTITSGGVTPLVRGDAAPAPEIPLAELGINRGDTLAPVRVIELSDYGCGYCRMFHMETFPALRAQFIETGMVEWKFMPFVTGMFDNSMVATQAAECTFEQSRDQFETLNHRLWTEQAAWKGSDDAAGVVRSWAGEAGVDLATYDACIGAGGNSDRIAAARGVAQRIGLRGTPTFVVVGYEPLQGALPADVFSELLQSVYEREMGGAR